MTDIQSALAPVKAYIFVSRSANSGAYFLAEVGVANNVYRRGFSDLSTYLLQMAATPFEARWSHHYVIEWSISAALEC